MKARQLDRLGGTLSFKDIPMPEPRPGTVLLAYLAAVLWTMAYLLLSPIFLMDVGARPRYRIDNVEKCNDRLNVNDCQLQKM